MPYVDLTQEDLSKRGRQLADALQSLDQELADQELAKKAMKARVQTLQSDVAKLKTEVRSGKEWLDEQGSLELGEEGERPRRKR